MVDALRARRIELRKRCKRIQGHLPQEPAEHMAQIAAWCRARGTEWDVYGTGALIEDFEHKIATLLGMPAARFVPSGKVAQNVAIRVWCERAGRMHFGMHPSSHLELHESRAYSQLFGLQATLVGPFSSPLLAEHLREVAEPMSALLTELPIREAGGQLPSWDELEELKACARERDVRLHLDGARLWECAAYYQKSYAEICEGFDSVYVSFYKGVGAISGAMLLGPRSFVDEAMVWQERCGAKLFTLLPNVASAAMLFDERIARMPAYYERACELADALADAAPALRLLPARPHTNMLHAFLPLDAETAYARRDAIAEEHGLWLFSGVQGCDVPGYTRFEWYVGESACALDVSELARGFADLLAD